MKTPGDILIQRHQQIGPKLDVRRRRALGLIAKDTKAWRGLDFHFALQVWGAVILPLRGHLAGLAASWLLIALLYMDPKSNEPAVFASRSFLSPQQIEQALHENQQQLMELFGSREVEVELQIPSELAPDSHNLQPPDVGGIFLISPFIAWQRAIDSLTNRPFEKGRGLKRLANRGIATLSPILQA